MAELGILVEVLWELVMVWESVEYLLWGVRGRTSALDRLKSGAAHGRLQEYEERVERRGGTE